MNNPILYTMPGTCALAPNIAVVWLDAPVQIENLERGEHKKDRYLSINPKGKVPALQFDDGDVLTEATAILAYLGTQYGKQSSARNQPLRLRFCRTILKRADHNRKNKSAQRPISLVVRPASCGAQTLTLRSYAHLAGRTWPAAPFCALLASRNPARF